MVKYEFFTFDRWNMALGMKNKYCSPVSIVSDDKYLHFYYCRPLILLLQKCIALNKEFFIHISIWISEIFDHLILTIRTFFWISFPAGLESDPTLSWCCLCCSHLFCTNQIWKAYASTKFRILQFIYTLDKFLTICLYGML